MAFIFAKKQPEYDDYAHDQGWSYEPFHAVDLPERGIACHVKNSV